MAAKVRPTQNTLWRPMFWTSLTLMTASALVTAPVSKEAIINAGETSFVGQTELLSAMAGTERIRRVANIVRKQQAAGHEVAVVVSAMAGETDRLVNFCREANPLYDPAEYDVVVASGEQVTSGLLALTLQAMGCKARSWLGWQLPIRTRGHAAALIEGIDAEVLERVFGEGGIAVEQHRMRTPQVEQVYLPVSRLLSLYVESAGRLHRHPPRAFAANVNLFERDSQTLARCGTARRPIVAHVEEHVAA